MANRGRRGEFKREGCGGSRLGGAVFARDVMGLNAETFLSRGLQAVRSETNIFGARAPKEKTAKNHVVALHKSAP